MVKIEFYDPSGSVEVKQSHAPRLATLQGKRIGFVRVGDTKWQTQTTLSMLREMLEADFPGVEVLPVDAFPHGKVIGSEATAALVEQSGVDAVIIGNAALGGCATACGRAAARLEIKGIPTVTVARRDLAGLMKNSV